MSSDKNSYEEQVDNFIEKLLKTFDAEEKRLRRKEYIFNQWNCCDETDVENACKIRCKNLKNYILSKKAEKEKKKGNSYILIAESPSLGGRYTGIALTSEHITDNYNLDFSLKCTSVNNKKEKLFERTADIVWEEITKSKNNVFIFWNAFAFNIHKKPKKWFEKPYVEELLANKEILQTFLGLFPNAKIIALGTTAEKALKKLNIDYEEKIRHPSMDFNKEFPKGIKKYL